MLHPVEANRARQAPSVTTKMFAPALARSLSRKRRGGFFDRSFDQSERDLTQLIDVFVEPQETMRTEQDRLFAQRNRPVCRDHDQRNRAELADSRQEFEAVHSGHLEIRDHQRVSARANPLQGFERIGGDIRLEAGASDLASKNSATSGWPI